MQTSVTAKKFGRQKTRRKFYFYKSIVLFAFTLICIGSPHVYGQAAGESRNLEFDSTDLKIIERADLILSGPSKWNRHDDRECNDDIDNAKYSLYCALYKASVDVAGKYVHRRAAIQIVRFIVEKYGRGRVKEHRLMDWNNHPDTTFADVKKVLSESIAEVRAQLKQATVSKIH